MRLKSLGISWFHIKIGPSILPHLQSLESLRLHARGSPLWVCDEIQRPLNRYGAHDIWKPLHSGAVNLRHLDVGEVDVAVVDYLASLSGLETLRIASSSENTDKIPDAIAYRFFTTVLPRHANSLKELYILVPPGNTLCFQTDYSNLLLRCEMLDSLSLSIAVDYDKDTSLDHVSHVVSPTMLRYIPMPDNISQHALIETARQLPRIRTLGLLFRIARQIRYHDGIPSIVAIQRSVWALMSAVFSFSPGLIQSNAGYPIITIAEGGKEIKMTKRDDDWGYEVRG